MRVYTEDMQAEADNLIEDYLKKHGKKPTHIEFTPAEFSNIKRQLKEQLPHIYTKWNVDNLSAGEMTYSGCIIVVK